MVESLTFAERANNYARSVVSGDVPASKYTVLACQRHLNDLDRQGGEDFPFVFNPLMHNQYGQEYYPAERVCAFIELLPHVKGKWARERKLLQLEDWQVFYLACTFGWIHKETALRRFRTTYLEIPRKNAKTTVASGIGLYMEVLDDEVGAEIVSAATSADQAKISWSIANQMVTKSPGMQARFGVKPMANAIVVQATASTFKYLSSDHKTLDGLNIHCGINDELHAMRTREVWDVLETATGSREQPLIVGITTAGSNQAGICYEQRDYVIKILTGVVVDDTYFGIIYTIDDDDDWTDERAWAKANPNLGVSVSIDDLRRKCTKAKTMPSAQNNFKTKHLNIWVNADVAWMDMLKFKKVVDEALLISDFEGEQCWSPLDLSSKIDICALLFLFRRLINNVAHYYFFPRYYLPEETIFTATNDQYEGWLESGRLIGTPGNVIDYDYIEEDLKQASGLFEILEVPYDPFQATQLSTRMIAEGFPMVEVRPTVLNFSEPMKELEALVYQRRIHYDGCPVTTWMMSNVVAKFDAKDNIYPRKQEDRQHLKIDGIVALIMGLGRAITTEKPKKSVYQSRGILRL